MQVLTTWDPSTWKTDHLMFSVACRSLRISGYRALSLWPWKMAWFCIIHLPKIWRFMAKSHPYFLCCIIFLCQIAKYLTPISALCTYLPRLVNIVWERPPISNMSMKHDFCNGSDCWEFVHSKKSFIVPDLLFYKTVVMKWDS